MDNPQVTIPTMVAGEAGAISPTALELLPSFRRHLAAENKSPRTIQSYAESVHRLHEYLVATGMPLPVASIRREHVEAFIGDQLTRLKPASARIRYASVRQFFKWAESEGEITTSPMAKMRPPKVPEAEIPFPSEDELAALIRAAEKDPSFYGRRDAALIRTFLATGARLSEVAALKVEDVRFDVPSALPGYPPVPVLFRFTGKGRRERTVGGGEKAALAMDRYMRARRQHKDAASPALWLGRHGPLTVYGLDEAIRRRARQAGVTLHVHQLRHAVAHDLRLLGVDDDSVLVTLGWSDRSMLHRYGRAAAMERARAKIQKLGALGDRL